VNGSPALIQRAMAGIAEICSGETMSRMPAFLRSCAQPPWSDVVMRRKAVRDLLQRNALAPQLGLKRPEHPGPSKIDEETRSPRTHDPEIRGSIADVDDRDRCHRSSIDRGVHSRYRAGADGDCCDRGGGTNRSYRVRAKTIATIAARIATAA